MSENILRSWIQAASNSARELLLEAGPPTLGKSLSDMVRCNIHYRLPLIEGMVIAENEVRVPVGIYGFKFVPHCFLYYQPTDEIVCFNAGQFIDPDNSLYPPGGRLKVFQAMCPDLVVDCGNGVYALTGTPEEIEAKTGLLYCVPPEIFSSFD